MRGSFARPFAGLSDLGTNLVDFFPNQTLMKTFMLFFFSLSLGISSLAQNDKAIPPPPPPPPPPPIYVQDLHVYEVDQMPIYPGCDATQDAETIQRCFQEGIMEYIMENVKYPEIAKESNVQGTVFLSFVVGKDGKVEKVKVMRSAADALDQEAIRVVKSLPVMQPGKRKGQNVGVIMHVPVKFTLSH